MKFRDLKTFFSSAELAAAHFQTWNLYFSTANSLLCVALFFFSQLPL